MTTVSFTLVVLDRHKMLGQWISLLWLLEVINYFFSDMLDIFSQIILICGKTRFEWSKHIMTGLKKAKKIPALLAWKIGTMLCAGVVQHCLKEECQWGGKVRTSLWVGVYTSNVHISWHFLNVRKAETSVWIK